MTILRWIRLALIGLVLGILAWHAYVLGCIIAWCWINPSTSAFMRQQAIMLQEQNPEVILSFQWVDYSQISTNLKAAVIAAEDANFTSHAGFDWDSIEKAIEKNARNAKRKTKKIVGGSTISQQLAKNLFLSPKQSYLRKAEEAIITFMIESILDKQRILEIYLNIVEWGTGIFGAQAASEHYFQTSAAKLSKRQAAMLAAMLPNPRYYDTHRNSRRLARKTQIILRRMHVSKLPDTVDVP